MDDSTKRAREFQFWLKSDLRIELTEGSHIRAVIDHPEFFGSGKNEVGRLYREADEPIGFEGHARTAILLQAYRSGWIRVRKYVGRRIHWMIEFAKFDPDTQQVVSQFLKWVKDEAGIMGTDEQVFLCGTDDDFTTMFVSSEGGNLE